MHRAPSPVAFGLLVLALILLTAKAYRWMERPAEVAAEPGRPAIRMRA